MVGVRSEIVNLDRLPIKGSVELATERLNVHIGQRMRWARGMIQIFRIDNPLLGRGLSIGQRICYLNAMMYFLFPIPRFVFLTAPIAYLLTSQNIIVASALMVMAYAGPQLFHTLATQSRLYGRLRYSFWGEIYDNVLMFHIMAPTLLALINPKAGKFNVTDKGGITVDARLTSLLRLFKSKFNIDERKPLFTFSTNAFSQFARAIYSFAVAFSVSIPFKDSIKRAWELALV